MEAELNERYRMWCKLIPEYAGMCKAKKESAKRNFMKTHGFDPNKLTAIQPEDYFGYNGYDRTPTEEKKKQESEMYVQITPPCPTSEISEQREHLRQRAFDARSGKYDEIGHAFGVRDDKEPVTINELIQRIKDGKYTISKDRGDFRTSWPLQNIRWRDPAMKEDQVGFDAASDKISKAFDDLQDDIAIKTPEEGLAALRAFQSATFN